MARALPLEYCGALYHVTSQGYQREDIYDDEFDPSYCLASANLNSAA
jgi:hypothetical protein